MTGTMKDTKGCVELLSNKSLFSYTWFRIFKTVDKENTEGVDYCGSAKTSHKGFFLATLEKSMKECLGRSHLVTKSSTRVPGDKLIMAI